MKIKRLLCFVIVTIMIMSSVGNVCAVNTDSDKTIIYVAPDGDDSNKGTIDSPFATITKARDTIRRMKASQTLGKDGAVVYLRGGEYALTESVEFTKEDSGTEQAPIIYRSYPEEEAVFIGCVSISWDKFKPCTDKTVLSRIIDESAREHILVVNLNELGFKNIPTPVLPGTYSYWEHALPYLEKDGIYKADCAAPELLINGKTMTVARYPNDGNMEIVDVPVAGSHEKGTPMEVAVSDKRILNWKDADEAIMYGSFTYAWASLATFVGGINEKKNSVIAKYPTEYGAIRGQQFYVFNLIEEIDIPGEYYIDRKAGKLYIYKPDEEVDTVRYTTLETPMFLFSDADYITFKNIGMKYTRSRAIFMDKDCNNNQIIGCKFSFTNLKYACYIEGSEIEVYDCFFSDCEGGLRLEGGDRNTLTPGNNIVENTKFERCDKLTKTYMDAILLVGVGHKVKNNDISDAQHCLVRMNGNFHEISYNDIHDGCKSADDMGAIYAGRDLTHRGNKVIYNYIHDIGGDSRGNEGVHGIFFDDFWSAADVAGNVFENITGCGIMLAGSHNVINNNLFINTGTESSKAAVNIARSFNSTGNHSAYYEGINAVPYKSEIWTNAFPEIANVIDKDGNLDMNNNIVVTNNVFYNSPGVAVSAQALKTAVIENNVEFKTDPGFYDLQKRVYILKEDSEIYEKIPDFKPIPFTRMGMYSQRAFDRTGEYDAFVFCIDSPYVLNRKQTENRNTVQMFEQNGGLYVPLRSGAEAIFANVGYDEETEKISVSANGKVLEFVDGEIKTVLVNGENYELTQPIININETNYIDIKDLVNIFGKQLISWGNLAIISDTADLFNLEADKNLLRYIEEQLSIY